MSQVLSRPQTINLYDGFICHDDVVVVASTSDYSITCLGRPPLLPSKSGLSIQVVSHSRSYKNHVLQLSTFFTDIRAVSETGMALVGAYI